MFEVKGAQTRKVNTRPQKGDQNTGQATRKTGLRNAGCDCSRGAHLEELTAALDPERRQRKTSYRATLRPASVVRISPADSMTGKSSLPYAGSLFPADNKYAS